MIETCALYLSTSQMQAYVRVKYREGGMYVIYSSRERAASEGCI